MFQELEQGVLSRESLSKIIQKPSLNLYPEQRAHQPLEEIIERMRSRDIRIQMLRPRPGSAMTFSISFSYPDRYKAAQVVRQLVSEFVNQHVRAMVSRAKSLKEDDPFRVAQEHKIGENLEVLDPANIPQVLRGPDRLTISAAGLAFGVLAGTLTIRLRQHRRANLQPA
jgi:hypothetical protein